MLKFLQERVNKKTKQIDGEQQPGDEAYKQVSEKQARVKELMRRLAVKLGKENDVEEKR